MVHTFASEVYSLVFETVFLVNVGNTLATAHPEANTSLLSQTMTINWLVLEPKYRNVLLKLWTVIATILDWYCLPIELVDLTILDKAWGLEGALCLEHLEGNAQTWILFKYNDTESSGDKDFTPLFQVWKSIKSFYTSLFYLMKTFWLLIVRGAHFW